MTYRKPWTVSYIGIGPHCNWQGVHDDYDGAPLDSDGPPADKRCFTGNTEAEVWERIAEYEERIQEALHG